MGLQDWIKYRIWAAAQYPDPELIHRHGGLFAVINYLKRCGSPEITRDVLRRFGADIHPEALPIGPWITVHEAEEDFSNLSVGRSAHIGKEVFLDLTDRIVIGESVAIGMRAIIITHLNLGDGYPNKPIAKLIPKRQKPTVIERGASVGVGSILLCGVTVGEDAVVGGGVVVSQDVPPRTILASTEQRKPYTVPEQLFRRRS
jgi:acetyltransferase-like isoleucine patch superfamily enzyme